MRAHEPIHEARRFNETAEEPCILMDHVWRNRDEIFRLLEPETREQIEFCCVNPDLRWDGDPDHPGVVCKNCDFVAVDCGNNHHLQAPAERAAPGEDA